MSATHRDARHRHSTASPDDATPAGIVQLDGKHVSLRHVRNDDYDFLYALETTGQRGPRYRNRGTTPGPDQFRQSLWQSVLVQFIIERRDNVERVGSVVAYGADLRNAFARVAVAFAPPVSRQGWVVEGWELFVDYLFDVFPFRKLYADVVAFNLDQFGAGLRYFCEEGRLHQHEYLDGRYWDLVILGLFREAWKARGDDDLTERILGRSRPARALLPADDFCRVLAEYFNFDPREVSPETLLDQELGLDSLQFYELTLLLEEASGEAVPEGVLANLQSVGDVYDSYELYRSRSLGSAASSRSERA